MRVGSCRAHRKQAVFAVRHGRNGPCRRAVAFVLVRLMPSESFHGHPGGNYASTTFSASTGCVRYPPHSRRQSSASSHRQRRYPETFITGYLKPAPRSPSANWRIRIDQGNIFRSCRTAFNALELDNPNRGWFPALAVDSSHRYLNAPFAVGLPVIL